METQFTTWSERLAELGYTVLLPSSYSARGFCDKHEDTPPPTFDDKTEQILGRIYDTDASARWLCDRPEVDCDRMGLLGFSQGGTMAMLGLHWQIEHALAYFRDTKGDTVDIEIPDVAPGRPEFQVGIAYYPGCGFDGAVPLSTKADAAIENKFLATAPLFVLHASDDPLVEHCSTEYGAGSREIQSGQVASAAKLTNTYEVTVYPDAGHSFDSAGAKADGGTAEGNVAAREAALEVTLAQLEAHLMN
jgi:dienelactone hydrolase